LQVVYAGAANGLFSVVGSSFAQCHSTTSGGAISVVPSRRTSISTSTFVGNEAATTGGAISISSGESTLPVILFKNVFQNNTAAMGGAVYADHVVDIRDSEFLGNSGEQFGGALYVTDAADVVDSLFQGNSLPETTGTQGGAAFFALTSQPSVKGVTFSSNVASEGGAVFTTSLVFSASESSFDGNRAQNGAAIEVYTGAATIVSSTFNDNEGVFSGAVFTYVCFMFCFTSLFSSSLMDSVSRRADLVLTGNTFTNNVATDSTGSGGAVSCLSNIPGGIPISITTSSTTFSGNDAGANGGAIFANKCKAAITGSTFTDNTVNDTLGNGGALSFVGGALTISSSTFENNDANAGSHIWTDNTLVATDNAFRAALGDTGVTVSKPGTLPVVSGNSFSGSGFYGLQFIIGNLQRVVVANSSPISGIWVAGGDLELSHSNGKPISIGSLRLPNDTDLYTHNNLVVTEDLEWGRSNITGVAPDLSITLAAGSDSHFLRQDVPVAGYRALVNIVMYNYGNVTIDAVSSSLNRSQLAALPVDETMNTCLYLANGAHYMAQPDSITDLGYYCHILGPVSSFFNASGHLYIDGSATFQTNFTSSNETATTYFTLYTRTETDAIHFLNGPVVIGGNVVVTAVPEMVIAKEDKFDRALITVGANSALWGSYNDSSWQITTGAAYGRMTFNTTGGYLFVDEAYRPDPNSGNIAAGLAGALIAIVFVIAVFLFIRPCICKKKKKDGEEGDEEKGETQPLQDKESLEMAKIDAAEKKKSKKNLKEKISESDDVPLDDTPAKRSAKQSRKKQREPEPSSDSSNNSSSEEPLSEVQQKKSRKKKVVESSD
jgi:predicted outer membrane repeat protein